MVEYGMPAETPPSIHNDTGHPRAVLLCRPNSHPFTDRNLALDHEVKVGRSVARAKPGPNNAIFDCKVLSRNHAVLWYSQGKFYLQDTKSSNGTFVNNQRLSKGTEESAPREVCSGDILQFGVDVMENSRQVTHGCIIATLKLYLPDGKEAKASPSLVNSGACIPPQDLYQLNTFIQESIAREQLLENKLIALQTIISDTELSSKSSWKALMEEDRLLTRVEILENQLGTYSKSMSDDKLREEAKRLLEDKEKYQIAAKDSLKKLVDEKLEMVGNLQDTETKLTSLQQEYNSIHSLYNGVLQENSKLSVKISDLSEELLKLQKAAELEQADNKSDLDNTKEMIIQNRLTSADIETYVQNGESGHINGKSDPGDDVEDDDILNNTQDRLLSGQLTLEEVNITTQGDTSDKEEGEQDLQEVEMKDLSSDNIRCRLKELENELHHTRDLLSESRSDNSVMLQDMNNLKNKLDNAERLIQSQDCLVKEMEIRVKESERIASVSNTSLTTSSTLPSTTTINQHSNLQAEDTLSQDDLELEDDSISPDDSISSCDYSQATLRPSSKNKKYSKHGGPPPALLDEMNARVAELEQQNYQLKKKILDMEEQKVNSQESEEIFDEHSAALQTATELVQQIVQEATLACNVKSEPINESKENTFTNMSQNNVLEQALNEENVTSEGATNNKTDEKIEKDESNQIMLEDKIEIIKQIQTEEGKEDNSSRDISQRTEDISSQTEEASLVDSLLNLSCSSCSELSVVESALSDAESKIAQLLKLRENLITVQAEKMELEQSVEDLEEEVETLSVTSRVLTVVNIIPVAVLLLAVFVAFLPSLSSLMGTRDV